MAVYPESAEQAGNSSVKSMLKRIWAPLLAVSLAQLVVNAWPVSITVGDRGVIALAVFFFGLFLAMDFIGGAVHAGIQRRRVDSSLATCLLDGAMIGLLSNLILQAVSSVLHGPSLDLMMPSSGDADSVLWTWKLVLSFVIMMIFGFMGLISGGVGGGAGYLISTWMSSSPAAGRHG